MRYTGKVKWYNYEKGFGFVTTEIDSEVTDVFIHFSEIKEGGYVKLEEGDTIRFDVVDGRHGYTAKEITISNVMVKDISIPEKFRVRDTVSKVIHHLVRCTDTVGAEVYAVILTDNDGGIKDADLFKADEVRKLIKNRVWLKV